MPKQKLPNPERAARAVTRADRHREKDIFPRHVDVPAEILLANEAFWFTRRGEKVEPPVELDTVPILVYTSNIAQKVRYGANRLRLGLREQPSNLRVHVNHQRSAALPAGVFYDESGKPYSCVNIKGAGNVRRNHNGDWYLDNVSPGNGPSLTGPWGYALEPYANNDLRMSERFYALGIHSHRVIAHLRPEYVYYRGTFLRPAEFARRFSQGRLPLIQLRAFTVPTRLEDLHHHLPHDHAAALLSEAWAMIRLRTGNDLKRHDKYLTYFARTLARQVATMHAAGYVHKYLTTHNITLDAAIVDLDSVHHFPNQDSSEFGESAGRDYTWALSSLDQFHADYPFRVTTQRRNFKLLFCDEYRTFWKKVSGRSTLPWDPPHTT